MISDGHKPSPTSVLRNRTFLMEIVRGTAEESPFDFLSIHKISNRPDNMRYNFNVQWKYLMSCPQPCPTVSTMVGRPSASDSRYLSVCLQRLQVRVSYPFIDLFYDRVQDSYVSFVSRSSSKYCLNFIDLTSFSWWYISYRFIFSLINSFSVSRYTILMWKFTSVLSF